MHSSQFKHSPLRGIALTLVTTFFLQQLSYAAPELAPLQINATAMPKISAQLPESIALIDDSYVAKGSDQLIFLMQDAHANDSGQMNMAKAIDLILQEEGVKYVFTEAGQDDNSLGYLKELSDSSLRKRVSRSLLRKGLLHGTEYLSLTGEQDFVLWGVEDRSLYDQGLLTYKTVSEKRQDALMYIQKISRTTQVLKNKLFSEAFLAFDDLKNNYEDEKISITEYFKELSLLATNNSIFLQNYHSLKFLKKLHKQESQIDFNQASQEQNAAIKQLSPSDQKMIRQAMQDTAKVQGHDDKQAQAFYALLKEKTLTNINAFPQFKKYLSYRDDAKKLNAKSVLNELHALEAKVAQALIKNTDEQMLFTVSNNARLLKKLFELQVTPQEFSDYQQNKVYYNTQVMTGFLNKKIMELKKHYDQALLLDEAIDIDAASIEAFYQLTYTRDLAFMRNIKAKMDQSRQNKAILVTGGYHTANLKALLKQAHISYVAITPQVLHETNHAQYEELLLGQLKPVMNGINQIIKAPLSIITGQSATNQMSLTVASPATKMSQPALTISRLAQQLDINPARMAQDQAIDNLLNQQREKNISAIEDAKEIGGFAPGEEERLLNRNNNPAASLEDLQAIEKAATRNALSEVDSPGEVSRMASPDGIEDGLATSLLEVLKEYLATVPSDLEGEPIGNRRRLTFREAVQQAIKYVQINNHKSAQATIQNALEAIKAPLQFYINPEQYQKRKALIIPRLEQANAIATQWVAAETSARMTEYRFDERWELAQFVSEQTGLFAKSIDDNAPENIILLDESIQAYNLISTDLENNSIFVRVQRIESKKNDYVIHLRQDGKEYFFYIESERYGHGTIIEIPASEYEDIVGLNDVAIELVGKLKPILSLWITEKMLHSTTMHGFDDDMELAIEATTKRDFETAADKIRSALKRYNFSEHSRDFAAAINPRLTPPSEVKAWVAKQINQPLREALTLLEPFIETVADSPEVSLAARLAKYDNAVELAGVLRGQTIVATLSGKDDETSQALDKISAASAANKFVAYRQFEEVDPFPTEALIYVRHDDKESFFRHEQMGLSGTIRELTSSEYFKLGGVDYAAEEIKSQIDSILQTWKLNQYLHDKVDEKPLIGYLTKALEFLSEKNFNLAAGAMTAASVSINTIETNMNTSNAADSKVAQMQTAWLKKEITTPIQSVKETILQLQAARMTETTVGDRVMVGGDMGLVLSIEGDDIRYMLLGVGDEAAEIRVAKLSDITEKIAPRDDSDFVFNPGDKVEIEYEGTWYPATLVQAAGGGYVYVLYEKVHDRLSNYQGHGLTSSYFSSEVEALSYGLRKPNSGTTTIESTTLASPADTEQTLANVRSNFLAVFTNVDIRRSILGILDAFALDEADANTVNGEAVRVFRALLSQAQAMSDETAENDFLATLRYFLSHPEVMRPLTLVNMLGQINAMPGFSNSFDYAVRDLKYTHSLIKYDLYDSVTSRGEPTISKRDADEQLGQLLEFLEPEAYRNRAEDEAQWFTDLDTSEARLQQAIELFNLPLLQHHFQTERGVSTAFVYATLFLRLITYIRKGMIDETFNPTSQAGVMALMDSSSIDSSAINIVPTEFEAERDEAAEPAQETETETGTVAVAGILSIRATKEYDDSKPGFVLAEITFVRDDGKGANLQTWIVRPLAEEPTETARKVAQHIRKLGVDDAAGDENYFTLPTQISDLSMTSGLSRMAEPDYALALEEIQMASRALLVAGQANHMVGFNRAGTDEIRGKLELAATQARAEDEAALQEVESALDRLNAFLENAIATPPRNRPLNDQIRLVKSHVVKAQKALPRMAGGARFAGNSEQQLLNKLRQASGLLVARVRGVALITQYGSSLSAADASLGDIIQVIQARDFLTAQNYFEIDQKIRIILSGLESARDEMIRESRDADIVRTRDIKQLVLRSRTILNGMVRKRTKSADPEKIEDLRLLIGGDRDSINQYTFKPRQFDIASSIGESEFTIERVRDWHHTEVAVKVVRAHINSIEAKTKRNIDLAVQSLRISSATASGLKLQLRGAATLNLHHVQAMAGVIAREITESTYIVGPGRIAFLKDVALSPLLDQRARVDSYLLDSLRRLNAAKSNNTNWIEAVKSIEEARSAIASMPEDGIGVLSGTSRILTAIASTYDKLSLAALELDSVSESANIRIAQRTLRLLSQSSKLISNIEAKALALSDDPNVLRVLILDETTGKDQTYIDYAEQLVALSQATGLTIELVPVDVLRDYYAAGKKTDPAKAQALIERYKPAVVFVKSNTNAFNAKKNAAGYEAFFEMAAKNRVKTIIRMGVGTDNIDNTAANANGITVIKSLGNENSVAELSVLFWLDALKKVVNGFEATGGDEISVGTTADDPLTIQAKEYFSKIVKKWALADRAGEDFDNDTFETRAQDVFAGMSLEDIKKLLEVAVKQNLSAGIFKHGGIGKLVVKKLNQLAKLADVELDIAANSSKLNHAAATAAGVTAAEKEDVFSKSVVFLHVPGEPQFIFTKDDFTSPDLKAVINPSRPATLPTDVLEHLLDRGIYVYEDVDMPGDEERQRLLGKYPKLYFNSAHVAAATKNAGVGVDNRSLSALIEVVRQLTGQGESDVFKKSDLSIVNAVEIKPIANARMADPKDGSEIADEFVSEALAQKVLDSGVRTITAFGAPGAGKNETVGGFREQLNSHLPQDKQFVSLVLGDYFSAINRIADNEERAGDAQYRPFAELVSAEDLRSMSDGKMMRDNTAINIVNAILDSDEYNAAYGIIFDGFPRTPVQLQQIEGKHIAWQNKPLEIDVHAILDVEEDVLAQRQRHRLEINIKTGAFRGGEEHLVSDGAINEQAFLTFFDERMQTFRELTSYVIDSKRSQPDTFAINAYVPNVGAKESIRTVRQRFADAFEAFLDARAARMAKITFDEARLEPIVQLIGGTRSLSEKYLFEANRTSIGSGATWKLKDIRQGTYGVETSLSIVKAHLRAIKVEINTTIEIIVEREAVNRQAAIRLRTELANEPQATYSEASNTLTKLQNRSRSTIKAEVEPVDRIEFNIQSLAKAGLTTKILIQAYDAALAGEIDYLTVVENVEVAQPKLTGLKATINVPQRDGSIIIDVSQLSSDSSMDIIIKAIVKNLKTASRMSGVTTAVIDQAAELEPELISLYTLVDSILTRDYIPRSEAEIELLTLFAAKVEVGKYAILESNQALYIADVDGVSGRREIRVQGQLITRFSQAAALANFAATDQAKQLAVDNVVDSLELSEKLRQALISGSAATNALNEKRKTNFNFGFGIPVAGLFDFKSITKASEREASAKLLLSIMQHSARSDWGKNGHAVFHITDANIANLPTNAIGLRRLWIAARENHDFISSEPLDPNSDEYVAVVLMINGEGGSSNAVNMNMEPAKRRHLLSSFANAITMAVRAFLTIVPEDESGVDEARLAFTQATSGLGDLFGIFNKMLKEPFESEPQALAGLRRGIYSPGQTFKSLLVKIGQYLQAVRTAIATVGMAA